MNKTSKITIGILVALVLITGLSVFQSKSKENISEKPTVKIGVTLPLTGDIAALGQSNKNAILLAKEQLKNTKYNYELVFEDDHFSPPAGASTANKLISIDKANALISFGSPVGNVVSPIAEKAQIPHINDFASDPNVANGDFNFLHYTPAYKDAEKFISELNKRGITKVVFFVQQDNPGATAIMNAVEEKVKGTSIQILSIQKISGESKDFRTSISTVKGLNPEAYVLEANSPALEVLAKQIREAGIKTPITSIETFEFSDQPQLFEGMWYVNAADPTNDFLALYKNKYNETPKFGAANGYDSFNLLVQSFEQSGDGKTIPTNVQVKDTLAHVKNFDGALGKNLSVDEKGMVSSEAIIRMIKDGKPMTVSQ